MSKAHVSFLTISILHTKQYTVYYPLFFILEDILKFIFYHSVKLPFSIY